MAVAAASYGTRPCTRSYQPMHTLVSACLHGRFSLCTRMYQPMPMFVSAYAHARICLRARSAIHGTGTRSPVLASRRVISSARPGPEMVYVVT
eukprot:3908081-Rhodomonas_salina.1